MWCKPLRLSFCLVFLSCLAAGQALSPAQIREKYASSIVLIKTDSGSGTGFVVTQDGMIATAFHVIAGAKKTGVKLSTGDIFDQVLLVAKDERKDLAILKIAGYDLTAVDRENSNAVKVGEHVTVIGNPLGVEKLEGTVTDGIVSGMRDFGWGYTVIQLSAPISPGNSGGPVFSERGKVIGIASFKLVAGENLNFAVPSNYLSGLLEMADKTHPIQTWGASGSDTVFSRKEAPPGLTGVWKSTCGSAFQIQDTGTTVRVLNIENIKYTYDLKWEGKSVFGSVTGAGASQWFLLTLADPDHIHLWWSKTKHGDTWNDALDRMRTESDKRPPQCRWIKLAD